MLEKGRFVKQPNREQGGFLFVELLLGLAILGIVLVAMVPIFLLAARQGAASSDITLATTLAQEKADELKATTFAILAGGSDTLRHDGMRYTRTWTITNDTPFAGFKTITVTVVPDRRSTVGTIGTSRLNFIRSR